MSISQCDIAYSKLCACAAEGLDQAASQHNASYTRSVIKAFCVFLCLSFESVFIYNEKSLKDDTKDTLL